MADLVAAGFAASNIQTTSLTADWKEVTERRYQQFVSDEKAQTALHGASLYQHLLFFYKAVAQLFAGGHVGGIRVVAHRPAAAKAAVVAAADLLPPPNATDNNLKRQATY